MDLVDPADSKLLPRSVLYKRRRKSLLGDILEHPLEYNPSSEDENAQGYFSLPESSFKHDLSPFGRVYCTLDRLTSQATVRQLTSPVACLKGIQGMATGLTENQSLVRGHLLSSLDRIVAVFGGEKHDMECLIESLCPTFHQVELLDMSSEAWVVATMTLLKQRFDFDDGILISDILEPFGLDREKFEALASVFDRARFEDATSTD